MTPEKRRVVAVGVVVAMTLLVFMTPQPAQAGTKGAVAGAGGGAWAGCGLGLAIGSVVPVLGNGIGCIGGAAIGAVAGAIAGSKIGDSISAWTALASIASGVIASVVYVLSYILSLIVAAAIAIITSMIAVILQLSNNIVNTPSVQFGYQMTLAVANLGFVLGIIIIAIATILHRESYGVKKTLWKLVAAAILVNFSLIIGGVIVNFSNQLTSVFMKPLPGGGGGFAGADDFARGLAGAFTPQREFLLGLASSTEASSSAFDVQQNATVGQQIASIFSPILSLVFVVFMLIVILITLVIFFIMLLIRYVALGILLIIMPLAWLLWIFPKTSPHFTKWWNEFIRWCLFAPIAMFFLFLAILTSQMMNIKGTQNAAQGLAGLGYQAQSGGILGSISSNMGSLMGQIVGTMLQQIMIVGLAIGGLYVANKFSILGAKEGIGAIKGGAKAFGTYVGKRGVQGALNLGSRIAAPKPVMGPHGGPMTPLNTPRAKVASWLYKQAQNPALKTQPGVKGLAASVWGGMKKGSGLFKGKEAHDWECQNCIPSGQPNANIIRSTKKPAGGCSVCHGTAAQANWKQV